VNANDNRVIKGARTVLRHCINVRQKVVRAGVAACACEQCVRLAMHLIPTAPQSSPRTRLYLSLCIRATVNCIVNWYVIYRRVVRRLCEWKRTCSFT